MTAAPTSGRAPLSLGPPSDRLVLLGTVRDARSGRLLRHAPRRPVQRACPPGQQARNADRRRPEIGVTANRGLEHKLSGARRPRPPRGPHVAIESRRRESQQTSPHPPGLLRADKCQYIRGRARRAPGPPERACEAAYVQRGGARGKGGGHAGRPRARRGEIDTICDATACPTMVRRK